MKRAKLLLFSVTVTLLAAPRPLTLDDLHKFKDAADPRCSPDGKWVAYTLATTDATADS